MLTLAAAVWLLIVPALCAGAWVCQRTGPWVVDAEDDEALAAAENAADAARVADRQEWARIRHFVTEARADIAGIEDYRRKAGT